MKTYEEMAQNVLTRIEEYEIEKQGKRQKAMKAAMVSIPICAAVIALAGSLHSGVVGNSNVPVEEPERSVVSSVRKAESMSDSSSEQKAEISSAQRTKSDTSVTSVTSSKKSASSKTDASANSTASAADGIILYYGNDSENYETAHNEIAPQSETAPDQTTPSSKTIRTSSDESEAVSSKTQSYSPAKNEDEDFDPEPDFEDIGDTLGMIYKDGMMYMQFSVYDDGFTLDENIGDASDFDGSYKYIKDVTGEVYTVKESRDVLIVKLSNGGTVALAKAGQLIVNGTPYCATMLDKNIYLADRFLGHVSDFEVINVPYLHYEIELSPNDEVYSVLDKDEKTLCIKQENGNTVIFVSMW